MERNSGRPPDPGCEEFARDAVEDDVDRALSEEEIAERLDAEIVEEREI